MSMAKDSGLAMAKRIELWPIERLVPYERNARTHSPEQVLQIVASIQEFGFLNPILVDGKDGIIAGHGRLAAARELALAEVPVVVLDHLSPEQRRAYVIADNKLALNAGWDVDLLQQEIAALSLVDFNLDLLGFDEKELAGLLDPESIDDEPPPGADDPGKEYSQKFAVAVECADEAEQERVYEDLVSRGLTCRLLTV
jgi:ParB-like chromosome segregation protein Spo0J